MAVFADGFSLGNTEEINKICYVFSMSSSKRIPPADVEMGDFWMLDLKKLKAREHGLLQRKARLESDLARLRKAEKDARRRDDTRRKIVLGGAMLRAVDEGTIPLPLVRALVREHVADKDKALFAGSQIAPPETGISPEPGIPARPSGD